MTLSPRRNIFEIYRSLLMCFAFFPLPRGFSVQISFTFSRTILQCRSKALTRASNLWLFRTLISTYKGRDHSVYVHITPKHKDQPSPSLKLRK